MTLKSSLYWLDAEEASIAVEAAIGTPPRIIYFGPVISTPDRDLIPVTQTRQHAPGSPAEEVATSLMCPVGSGFAGAPGLKAHRAGRDWAVHLLTVGIETPDPQTLMIKTSDQQTKIAATHIIKIDPTSGLLHAQTVLTNRGESALQLDRCPAICVPLADTVSTLTSFTGKWASEFQTENLPIFTGTYYRENRAGRTSHDCFPGLLVCNAETSETTGLCYAAHLGWSGNHYTHLERLSDGRTVLQMGAHFFPGELILEAGGSYTTPTLLCATSASGKTGTTQMFHRHARKRSTGSSRPIHYNTWEAVYFDLTEDRLFELASQAASVGAERFVLDDGWFGARRNDAAGLGDWTPSRNVLPNGLTPLINHVLSLGMEFGLWVEPEMVNPDSDLHRAHPDWVLRAPGLDQIDSRNQYVLDLTRTEVANYLFGCIDTLLSKNKISYLKWDMNRNIHHPGTPDHAASIDQTLALYDLLDRIKTRHPSVDIESCASGGGRADYGILERTDRLWTSDNNDALERQIIQRGASHFFPTELLGSHVGPAKCHITGRKLSMELRVATAFFGHMGLEVDLSKETDRDLEILKRGLELHRSYRDLIHSGEYYRISTKPEANAFSIVSEDRREALLSYCQMASNRATLPPNIRFADLDKDALYRIRIIWPAPVRAISQPSILDAMDLTGDGLLLSGTLLMNVGLQLPLLHPETCLIFHLAIETESPE